MSQITARINGRDTTLDVAAETLLVDLLRGPLGLTGTHVGCDTSQCGACTVLIDGECAKSCTVLALQVAGRSVTTIEGLAPDAETLHPVQEAFIACHGLQCGFCTPGMIMTATCLLQHEPAPSDERIAESLDGNLCRCTGYVNIVAAVKQAAQTLAQQREPHSTFRTQRASRSNPGP